MLSKPLPQPHTGVSVSRRRSWAMEASPSQKMRNQVCAVLLCLTYRGLRPRFLCLPNGTVWTICLGVLLRGRCSWRGWAWARDSAFPTRTDNGLGACFSALATHVKLWAFEVPGPKSPNRAVMSEMLGRDLVVPRKPGLRTCLSLHFRASTRALGALGGLCHGLPAAASVFC